jgi:hypothetical protein
MGYNLLDAPPLRLVFPIGRGPCLCWYDPVYHPS